MRVVVAAVRRILDHEGFDPGGKRGEQRPEEDAGAIESWQQHERHPAWRRHGQAGVVEISRPRRCDQRRVT